MNKEKILQAVNENPLAFLTRLNIQKRIEMQVANQRCVFIRNHIKGGAEVCCNGFWVHLSFDKIWVCD